MIAVVERTLALLALAALALAVVATIGLLRRRLPVLLGEGALPIAAGIAVVATAGSLFLSEVAGYVPCTLCWYQRFAMYPLAVSLTVAAIRQNRRIRLAALPIATVGLSLSAWHVAIERRPSLGGVCDPAAPCSVLWVNEFGFLTIPTMAGIGFLAIIVLVLVAAATGPSREVVHDHVHQEA